MEEFYPKVYHPEETEDNSIATPEKGVGAERQETGKNVIMHIFLIRHGERLPNQISAETELTEEGVKGCIELGNKIGRSSVIGGEYSCRDGKECIRTKKTAELMVYSSRADDKRPVEEREELASHASERFRNKIQAHVKTLLAKNNPGLSEKEISNIDLLSTVEGIDFYLNCKDEDLDTQTYSPLETAASAALRVNAAIEKTSDLKSDSAMDYLLATHDYVIAAFLQQVLRQKTANGEEKRGFDSLTELGNNPIDFLENAEIIARTDNDGNKTVGLMFRGENYGMDMERLNELVAIGKDLKENGRRPKNDQTGEKIPREEL